MKFTRFEAYKERKHVPKLGGKNDYTGRLKVCSTGNRSVDGLNAGAGLRSRHADAPIV